MTASEAWKLVHEIERGLARPGMREGADCSLDNYHWRRHFATHETRVLFESVASGNLRKLREYLKQVDDGETRMPDPEIPGAETPE